ncbi:uncharacterized protein DUF2750 [Cupriavidus gilardii J11]|uniref:Uncharacterized protein DUF2750 n=1 Tax=Cupriavidus gilardii J11 TaxID=936133 RepID=A0A562BDX3_9BURK|nr:uncharacterized protein DUF2750 [Cupriavidus gilardii J11]
MVFWSDAAYARRHARTEWAGYMPTSIDLDDFVAGWLFNTHEDGVLAGVNFNADLAGVERDPRELALALADESQ